MRFLKMLLAPLFNQFGGVLVTYDDGNRLEDVMRTVVQLSPTDTPFMSGTKKTKAYNTLHEWPEDSLAARAANAKIEGSSFSAGNVTPPSRVNNVTQIFDKVFEISSTQKWVKAAGIDSNEDYYREKAMKEIGGDIELALLRGSKATGNASVARQLAGAINFITTNYTAVASGTKLTESFYNGLMELAWEAGGNIDEVYVGARLKRIISAYTAGATKQASSDDRRLVNAVDVYESDFGVQKIFKSRDMLKGDLTAGLLGIDSTKFAMAIGEPIHELPPEEVAQTGHAKTKVIRGELTLEVQGQAHCVVAKNLSELFN